MRGVTLLTASSGNTQAEPRLGPRLRRGVYVLSIIYLAAFPSARGQKPIARDLPIRESILARAEHELPTWRGRLPANRPRLFFTAKSWSGLRQRYAASTGFERKYFDAALDRAREIVERRISLYRSPAEMRARNSDLTPMDADQELWQRPVGDNMVGLSFALALREDGATRAKLHELVLAACHYPNWGVSNPNEDLSAGHIARGIAVAYDWHPDLWSESDRLLIRSTIRERMKAMCHIAYGGVYWAGHYAENHDHVSIAGLGLCGLAFLDEIPEAPEWITLALDNFEHVARDSNADGSSDEGVSYWSYGMSFTLQFIEGADLILGTRSLYSFPYFRNSISNRLHAATPDLAYTIPWGDTVPRDYYGPHHLLYRLAAVYRDGSGQYLADHLPFPPGGGADCVAFTALWYDPSVSEAAPWALDHYSPSGAIVDTRSGWGAGDYMLSFKAGYTNRNHSHLDAGAVALSFGHDWLINTAGYGHGKGEREFWNASGPRWTYQSNATESESTLLINGKNQRFEPEARGNIDSYTSARNWEVTSADLTGAYSDVTSVRRTLLHRRGDYILILDHVESPEPVTVEWLAQVPLIGQANGERLLVGDTAGLVTIGALQPAGLHFEKRAPTSPHLDISPDRMVTYALKQRGREIRYAVALLPRFSGQTSSAQKFSISKAATGDEITVIGSHWQDQIRVNSHDDPRGHLLAVRHVGPQFESAVAQDATDVDLGALRLRFRSATTLAIQEITEGDYIIDASTPFTLAAPLPDAWQLLALSNENTAVLVATSTIPPGQYALAGRGHTSANARAWLARPYPMHAGTPATTHDEP